MKKYSNEVMQAIRQGRRLDANDESQDDIIMEMPKEEAFEGYLNWNGLFAYGESILRAVSSIYEVKLGDSEDEDNSED